MNIRNKFAKLKRQLAREGNETKCMISTYRKVVCGTASEEEVDEANDQFKDLLKSVGLGGMFILPGGSLLIPVVVKLADKVGINLLPTSFNEEEKTETK